MRPPHSATMAAISSMGKGKSVIEAPSVTSLGRTARATVAKRSRSTVSSTGSNGTSTICSPRTPAGPSGRLLECPPMVGIARMKRLLEQLHAQRLDLIDILRASEPAIDRADVALGGARADLS